MPLYFRPARRQSNHAKRSLSTLPSSKSSSPTARSKARAALTELLERKIERRHALPVANLLRRAHLSERAVSLLHKIVRSERQLASPPTDAEKAEYAASLNNIGASQEALHILTSLNPVKTPIALLFLSYAYMWQWDWDSAVPALESYAKAPGVAPDMHLWGLVNLASALMHGPARLKEAREAIDAVLAQTAPDHFRMLHKSALLALTQWALV